MHEDLLTGQTTSTALSATAERLANIVHEGHRDMPGEQMPLICKPKKIESWRLFKIMSEFVEGFDIIRKYSSAISIFGSARATDDSAVYQHATKLATRLSKQGFAIITGGSSGVMQAANKGAYEAGGASVGLNIKLPNSQAYNPYLTEKFFFDHFFVRKVMLTFASECYVYFPGGFGTLDEFFEILTLVQTKKTRRIPLVLVGKEYWEPLCAFIDSVVYKKFDFIDSEDMDLYTVVDSVDEAYEYIISHVTC